jgi:tetratricopeptide (TPR) repeat protein
MQYRNTEKTSPQIAEELGVAFLLEGGVQTVGGKVRINAQLIDAVQDKHVWSENYDRELADIFAIQSEIAQKIASQLKAVLTPQEIEQIDKQRTDNLEAYNSYLMGRYFWNKRTEQSLKKSVEYFEQALAADPEYALAHAGLADAYLILVWRVWLPKEEGLPMAKEHAIKALEIDPNLGEAHATLGSIVLLEWQWQEAETELLKAIELNPNYATGRQYYSEYLHATGQPEEARKQINLALELDPLSLVIHGVSSSQYYNEGELDMALKENLKVLEFDQNRAGPYWKMFIIYREQGRDEEAFKHLKKSWSLNGSQEYAELTEDIYAKTGIDGVIRWWMDEEVNKSPNNPVFIAWHYAILGEKDLALGWLERAFELHSNLLVGLKGDRTFESLRSEPGFIALLEKMGLEADY